MKIFNNVTKIEYDGNEKGKSVREYKPEHLGKVVEYSEYMYMKNSYEHASYNLSKYIKHRRESLEEIESLKQIISDFKFNTDSIAES